MIKAFIGKFLSWFGYRIVKKQTREDEAFDDQIKRLGISEELVIFDVGGYDGEIAKRYYQLTKGRSRILSFEPFPESFDKLVENVKSIPAIEPLSLALGNTCGEAMLKSNRFAATNSLMSTDDKSKVTWQSDVLDTLKEIKVPVTTIDQLVKERDLSSIDILKMDTQGSEFMVLEGAADSLKNGLIKMIYTEIIVMPTYVGQKNLDEMLSLIRGYGYRLVKLYQSFNQEGDLRYLDALFVHENHKTEC